MHKHGLAVMRCQPFHVGHNRLISRMMEECEKVTIVIGSIQEHGTARNPFSYNTRKKMIQNAWRSHPRYDDLRIMGLQDINNAAEWAQYVIEFVNENTPFQNPVDAYYCGTDYDGHWFRSQKISLVVIPRIDLAHPFVSASMVREMISYGDPRWRDFVPPENHSLIETELSKRAEGIV